MNWKAIIGLLVLLGAGLGTWVALKDRKVEVTPPGETATRIFPGLTSGEVQKLDLVWRDPGVEVAVAFERDGQRWKLTTGALQDAGDPAHVRKLLEAFVKLRQRRAVPAEGGTDYGLEPGQVQLKATLKDGRELAIRMGKVAWQDNLRYLQVDGEQSVRIVPDELFGHARHEFGWFRDHTVATIPPFEVKQVSVTTPAGTMELEMRPPSNPAADPNAPPVWVQMAPVEDDADTAVVQDFLVRIYRDAKARKFIDQVPTEDRATYGLDNPFLDVTLTGEKGATCRVRYSEGKGTHGGKTVPTLYALRDGRLFDCGPDHLESLRIRDLKFFRSRELTPVNDKALNLLQATAPAGARWSVVREGHKWGLAEPRRLNVNGNLIRLLPDIVDGLKAERYFDKATEADWAGFEVDDANGTTVKLADMTGIHSVMTIGKEVPNTKGGLRYVRLHDRNRIRAMNSRLASVLTGAGRGWLYFLDKQLWKVISPEVTTFTVDVRTDSGVKTATWDVKLKSGAQTFTLRPGGTDHAASHSDADLADAVSALATRQVKRWLQDGHGSLEGFDLTHDLWSVRVTLTLDREGKSITRSLVFGKEIQWPAPKGAGKPTPEICARTGGGNTLAGPMIFTLNTKVRDALRALVIK